MLRWSGLTADLGPLPQLLPSPSGLGQASTFSGPHFYPLGKDIIGRTFKPEESKVWPRVLPAGWWQDQELCATRRVLLLTSPLRLPSAAASGGWPHSPPAGKGTSCLHKRSLSAGHGRVPWSSGQLGG